MAEMEKLSDDTLDAVSGGTKYTVAYPVDILGAPNGGLIARLYPGEFFVTDGSCTYAGGVNWYHVYFARGEGYVNGAVIGC